MGKFLKENRGFITSSKIKTDTVYTLVEGKGKDIMDTSPSILKKIKIVEIEPSVKIDVHTNIKIPVNTESE